ncbi:AfsA-related hotdog domain-containing protein [Arthrobacter sp. E3]|uniref:AfsA-related hotdog domain-containing protein n=1 Tax=Arthrobacter sp. E3 TaxID=517402 RepID=UPI001A946371|nr:AfsA-related hotdog domain-containing protein [Arthrobacter sp. E3]
MVYPIDAVLVHKRAPEQVLLTSAARDAQGCWVFQGSLPPGLPGSPGLPVPGPGATCPATLLAVELVRQAKIAYTHLVWDVPLDWAFIINELSFTWTREPATIPALHTGPVQVRVRSDAAQTRNGRIRDLQLSADLLTGGTLIGTGRGDFTCLPARTYQGIRRSAAPDPGHSTAEEGTVLTNVALDTDTLAGQLAWNRDDRFIFDHASDHVPGILIAQATLKAHQLLTSSTAGHISLLCHNFAEYNAPIAVNATLTEPGRTRISITEPPRV